MNRNLVTEWDPNRIRDRIPCVLGAVGSRRCGKSTSVAHLVYQMFDVFDLVICFVGSAACSPTLEAMMESHPKWDTRMFFSSWNQPLIDKLQEQQEKLKKAGVDRQVLILMDDVILTGRATDQLAHLCMRGRHFNISVMMAAFPAKQIAELSYIYRTLGLGYANIGAYLMVLGIPYDSDTDRVLGFLSTLVWESHTNPIRIG